MASSQRDVIDQALSYLQTSPEGDYRTIMSALVSEVRALRRDVEILYVPAQMYLSALDDDPENEYLTLPQAMRVTEIREVVERRKTI